MKAKSDETVSRWAKWGLLIGMIAVTLGVVLTLLLGYRPAPQKIMKPSFFDHPEEIGAVTLKRFYASIGEETVVILGVPSNRDWATPFVRGFIESARANHRAFQVVLIEKLLSEALRKDVASLVSETSEIESNTETMSAVADGIEKARLENKKTLIVVPNIYSTRLIAESPLMRLEKQMNQAAGASYHPFFSISVGPLALDPSQEKELDPVCMGSERDGSGTSEFGCAIAQAGRGYYRKRILETEPNAKARFVAIMQSTKPNDYLLLVREPEVRK